MRMLSSWFSFTSEMWEDSLYKFHLSAADIHLIMVDWDPHYITERAKACACMCVFMHVNKDEIMSTEKESKKEQESG